MTNPDNSSYGGLCPRCREIECTDECMTNPDNVGRLPELPAWMSDYTIPNDEFEVGKDVRLSDRMRAYGELCRAAPAGGECQHEWQPDADVMNARYCPKCDVTQTIPRKQAKDSAPAGSGEVEDIAASLEQMTKFVWRIHEETLPEDCVTVLNQAAALLRKLQQGAE